MYEKNIGTKQKALRINLDRRIYGSFAEIGAGQETAAMFFKAGGSSGTIAKTMSAYDMTFSDSIYGVEESGRYVVESRLVKMLSKEYSLLEKRLAEKRGSETTFFAFANTVVALNYQKTNDAHGWIGCRFQLSPQSGYNDVIIHVRMLDNENVVQQQALGIIGVNLIYGAFYYAKSPETLVLSLMDDLTPDRIQIDMIRFSGPDFADVDNRLMSLHLVRNGFTDAALFGPDGQVLQPSEALYKKNILVMRGRLRPVTNVQMDMIENGVKQFKAEHDVDENRVVSIAELTLHNLKSSDQSIDEKDFLDRVDILCSMGQTVMISNYLEYYKLVAYLARLTRLKIGLVVGIPNLEYIFEEDHYEFLPGGILESFATLFSRKVKLFVYPTLRNDAVYTCNEFELSPTMEPLFQYLVRNDKIEDITDYNEENLHISTDRVLEMIQQGEDGWEQMVPERVAQRIKDYCLFGYPCEVDYVPIGQQVRQKQEEQLTPDSQ
ncbi:TonB-dependent receptor [Spirosoma sp. KUDC1026]|uniref:TonB-dependent receptor n=1 Tax=Spirosoma sp. KUDC1026 TaxID=2745947 RepID=UPI00159B8908|nr:TonB-dependent receptor [Spirosoma sp. KUDC1026]QKZ11303.1 TonB-dependent receptor [Spirosoma sp. KUDC1026]